MLDKLEKFMDNLNNSLCKSIESCKSGIQRIDKRIDKRSISINPQLSDKIECAKKYLTVYLNLMSQIEDMFIDEAFQEKSFLTAVEIDEDVNSINKKYKSALLETVDKHKNRSNKQKKYKIQDEKVLESIDGISLQGNKLKLPIIKSLSDIPPMFYWYDGDNIYKKGIYISICRGFYAKVAFPNVLMPDEGNNRLYSLRCKYEDKKVCKANKLKMSHMRDSNIRDCFYVHKKEKFNKVSNQFRCCIDGIGNHENLNNGLNTLSNFDVKHFLMYSLSDDLLMMIWYQNKFNNGNLVLSNLDVF